MKLDSAERALEVDLQDVFAPWDPEVIVEDVLLALETGRGSRRRRKALTLRRYRLGVVAALIVAALASILWFSSGSGRDREDGSKQSIATLAEWLDLGDHRADLARAELVRRVPASTVQLIASARSSLERASLDGSGLGERFVHVMRALARHAEETNWTGHELWSWVRDSTLRDGYVFFMHELIDALVVARVEAFAAGRKVKAFEIPRHEIKQLLFEGLALRRTGLRDLAKLEALRALEESLLRLLDLGVFVGHTGTPDELMAWAMAAAQPPQRSLRLRFVIARARRAKRPADRAAWLKQLRAVLAGRRQLGVSSNSYERILRPAAARSLIEVAPTGRALDAYAVLLEVGDAFERLEALEAFRRAGRAPATKLVLECARHGWWVMATAAIERLGAIDEPGTGVLGALRELERSHDKDIARAAKRALEKHH